MNPDIRLDEDDLTLIIEVSRLGVADLTQMAFATGEFGGVLSRRVEVLLRVKALSPFEEDKFCATAEGLVSAYMHDAYLRCKRTVREKLRLKMRGLRLTQRHVARHVG